MPNPLRSCALVALAALLQAACQDASQVKSANGGARTEKAPRRAAPAPALVIPSGTVLPLELRTTLSTASSHTGDLVVALLREDVRSNGRVALPAGTELRGHVTAAVRPGKAKGQARLALRFDEATLRRRQQPLQTTAIDITAAPQKKRDASIIGGGVGAGALIGAATGGKQGAGIGALLGGAAGGGAVLLTRGRDIELKAGTALTVSLERALRL